METLTGIAAAGQGRKRAVKEDWRGRRIETLEAKIARLERMVDGQWQELDFFESALRRIEESERRPR